MENTFRRPEEYEVGGFDGKFLPMNVIPDAKYAAERMRTRRQSTAMK